MKTIAFILRRLTVSDPLTVEVVHNDFDVTPEWSIEGPSVYRAAFPFDIGYVPKQVTAILGSTFQHLVVEGSGQREFVLNAMVGDSEPLEAELADYLLVVHVVGNTKSTAMP